MPSEARQTKLTIDLGDENVELIRLEAVESLSQHFAFSLDLLAEREIDLLPHLGKPVVVAVCEDDHHLRYFNGIPVAAELIEEVVSVGFIYRLTLRPAAFLHSQGRDFKIFQNKTTQDIIQKVLEGCGIQPTFKLSEATPNRSYCVQYGESNFGFVSRLMEEDGLYYFYKHSESSHELVICDGPSSHEEGEASPLTYKALSGSGANVDSATRFSSQSKYIQAWHERVATGAENKVSFRDFDFMKPEKAREAEYLGEPDHKLDEIEVYDFPGRFFVEDTGKLRTKALLQARRANRRTFSGQSHNAAIACGTTFNLREHPNERFAKNFLVTSCHHSIAIEHHRAGVSEASGNLVHLEAVFADTKWRAPMTARRPVVMGPETAIVTGPKDETIYTDKFGRIKVKFHWDRENPGDECSSCWIRCSQTGGLGNNILPRVGHEVLVDFMSGDPDRPIVVGRVFNQAHMPIYALPDHKTKALWGTLTYGDPVDAGAKKKLDTGSPLRNELRFEDKAGHEEVFVHGQKDMNFRTINNQTNKLGNDQFVDIGQHRTMEIGVDDKVKIGNNKDTDIKADEKRHVGNNRETKIDTNEKLDVGSEILIQAGQKIVLKVGSSTITMDGTSIDVKTTMLTTNGSATAEHQAGMMTVKAIGITTIQGSMVKIN